MKNTRKPNPNISCLGYDVLTPPQNGSYGTGNSKTNPPPGPITTAEDKKSKPEIVR